MLFTLQTATTFYNRAAQLFDLALMCRHDYEKHQTLAAKYERAADYLMRRAVR